MPLCNYLIERYGDVEFHFFMTERNAAVARLFFPKAYVHVFSGGNKYFSHWKMAQKCKYLNFDIGISPVPESSKLNNLFLWALCAKDRYGRYTSNWFSKFSINHRVLKYDDKEMEQVELFSLKLFDNFCFIPLKYYPRINTALLDSYHRRYQKCGILLEVSNSRYRSQLSNDKMASLIEELSKNYDISVMITAMEKDRDKAKALEQQLNVPTEFFVTQDFKKYVEFVNAADIVLCGDGGLMHIAAALMYIVTGNVDCLL